MKPLAVDLPQYVRVPLHVCSVSGEQNVDDLKPVGLMTTIVRPIRVIRSHTFDLITNRNRKPRGPSLTTLEINHYAGSKHYLVALK